MSRPKPRKAIDRILWVLGLERRGGSVDVDQKLLNELRGMSRNASGVTVSPESALSLTVAYACINVVATDVSSLPFKVFQLRGDGGRGEVRSHPVSELLGVSPDGETTSMRWRQAWLGQTLGWGNGYNEVLFDGDGFPASAHLMPSRTTKPVRGDAGELLYEIEGGARLPARRVLHLAGLGGDGLCGYSPITLARQAVGMAIAAETFGAAFFANASKPSGVIEVPNTLSAESTKRLRESWQALQGGAENVGKVAVLEQGAKFSALSINPEDAQFLETRKFQVEEIIRLFRVPPHKVGDFSQSHLANIEAANLDYVQTVLMPWCEAIEQEVNRKLFTRAERAQGLFAEHVLTALLRGDSKSRSQYYRELRDLGVLSPNEIRRFENLNPLGEEGDVRLVPLNMTTLANAGRAQDPEPEPEMDPEPDDNDDQDGSDDGGMRHELREAVLRNGSAH